MAPLFYFLFIGIFLGLMTGVFRHEDGFGFFSEIELGLLGSIFGGMSLVFWTNNLDFRPMVLVVPALTALLMIFLLGWLSGNKRKVPRSHFSLW